MKNLAFISVLLILLSSSFGAHANFAAGGHIEVEWLHDSTCQVTFKYLRFCQSQTPAPDSMQLCVYNNCTNQIYGLTIYKVNGTITAKNLPNGYILPLTCDPATNKCNNSSGSFANGVSEWWYTANYTFPIRCSYWRFGVTAELRTDNDNLAVKDSMYVETTLRFLNLVDIAYNTTPGFLNPAFAITCNGQPTLYNNGARDKNGDSLVYSIIQPLHDKCTNSIISHHVSAFKTQSPAIQLPSNPLKCNNSFSLNKTTGTSSFIPAAGGSYPTSLITYLIEEYRGGQLIGSVMRDVQIATFNCSNPTPTFTPVTGTIIGSAYTNKRLEGCIEQPMQMCFDIKSTNGAAILKLSDDHSASLPPATISYSGQGTNTVRGCFNWTPTLSYTGLKKIMLDVLDSTCTNGLLLHHYIELEVYIAPPVQTNKDSIVCINEPVQLNAVGGYTSYSWQVLPGAAGNLSCTNCSSPVATSYAPVMYIVNAPGLACTGNKYYADTVRFSLNTAPTMTPNITLSVSPATTIGPGIQAIFTANVNGCKSPEYQWRLNGTDIAGATAKTWSTVSLNDLDRISCELVCADTCPLPRIQVSDSIIMHITNAVPALNSEMNIMIYPNPNNGNFTIVSSDAFIHERTSVINILNTYGQVVYIGEMSDAKQEITTQNLPAGMYMLRLVSGSEARLIRFVVK